MVDMGTCYHLVSLLRVGGGEPGSARCLDKFMSTWARWAAWPKIVVTDRDLYNRGSFAKGLSANGVYLRQASLESPEHLGQGDRHGGIFKCNFN